jgi:murein DD-endopeptidase MepM/ murein hydrolase activator NlpD
MMLAWIQVISAQSFEQILDTVDLNGRSVLLMKSNRWLYLEDYVKNLAYDSLFSKSWVTKDIHSYSEEKNNPITERKISLIENASEFVFPLDTFKLLRGFTGYHTGIDLKSFTGDTVCAAFDGRVRFASNIRNGYGNLVIVRHYNGIETYYSHLSKILVNVDDIINAGNAVGLVGSTGRATGPHLHFETRYHDIAFDPFKFIDGGKRCLVSDSLLICNNLLGRRSGDKNFVEVNGDHGDSYTIIRGDTLYKIARQYNTSVEVLCQLNNISRTTILRIGQKLILP